MRPRSIAWAATLLFASGIGACTRPVATTDLGGSVRLIEPATETLSYFLHLLRHAEAFERIDLLPLLEPADARAMLREADGRVRLTPGRAPAEVRADVRLDASETAVIELRFDLRPARHPSLSWTSDRPCEVDPRIDAPRVEQLDRDHVYVFPVAAHPCWAGVVSQLRWSIVPHPRTATRILEARAIPEAAIASLRPELAARSWRLSLGGELRTGVVLTPGEERQWAIAAKGSRFLRFAYGVDAVGSVGARISLSWRGEDGRRVALADLEASPAGPSSWSEGALELPKIAVDRGGMLLVSAELDGEPGILPPIVFLADLRRVPAPESVDRSRPPVVLVSVDTLRADRLSMYGNARPTSPHLDAWAARHAVRFDQAVAQAPWTLPSHTSMLTGLSTFRHGVNFDRPLPGGLVTLAERLADAGYRTIGVTGGAWMGSHFAFDQGFDVFFASPTQDDRAIELDRGIETALRHLAAAGGEPVFLFFHTYDVHGPHRPRSPWFESWSDEDPKLRVAEEPVSIDPETGLLGRVQRMRLLPGDGTGFQPLPARLSSLPLDIYDSEVADMDSKVGALIERVENDLGAERPLIVFTSDHGESLGEHDVAGHNNLYEEVVRVPLAIRFPDGEGAGRSVPRQVRSIDIVPTILRALDLPGGEELDGAPLQPLVSGERGAAPRPAWTHSATGPATLSLRLESRLKLISSLTPWGPGADRHELFDLRRDPAESTNLAEARSDTVESLRARAIDEIRQRGRGLLLYVESRRETPVRLALLGPTIERGRVRVLLGGAADVDVDDERGLVVGVTPGAPRELWLEGVSIDRLELRIDGGAAVDVDLAQSPATALQLDGATWSPAALGAEAAPGGLLVRLVARAAGTDASSGLDAAPDELRSTLRALGYL